MAKYKRQKMVDALDTIDEMPEQAEKLNNYQRMFATSIEDMAKVLCNASSCMTCPQVDLCDIGTNGWLKWLGGTAEKFGGIKDDI